MEHLNSEQVIKMLRIFRTKNKQLITNEQIEKILKFNLKIKSLSICFIFYFSFLCFFYKVINLGFFIPISLALALFSIHCLNEHIKLNKNGLKSLLNQVDLEIFKEEHDYNCKNKSNQKLKYTLYSLLVYYELIRESDYLNDIKRNLTKYNLNDLDEIEKFYLKHKKEIDFIRTRLEVRKNERAKPLNGQSFYIIENIKLPFIFRC